MKRCFLFVAFALTLLPLLTWAAEKPTIVIKGSGSPDGRKDIVIIEGDEDSGAAAGTAKIRDVKTGSILGAFAWSGFGVHPDAEAFQVLWRPDSRCFAINWEKTRGFVGCAAYIQSVAGWVEVRLPDFGLPALRLARAAGPAHVVIDDNWGGKGHETAVAWLPGNRLRVETGYRGIWTLDVQSDWPQYFWFTLGIAKAKAGPKAIVKEARLAPLSVYHQPGSAPHS